MLASFLISLTFFIVGLLGVIFLNRYYKAQRKTHKTDILIDDIVSKLELLKNGLREKEKNDGKRAKTKKTKKDRR